MGLRAPTGEPQPPPAVSEPLWGQLSERGCRARNGGLSEQQFPARERLRAGESMSRAQEQERGQHTPSTIFGTKVSNATTEWHEYGGRVSAVKADLGKIVLTNPVCTEVGEKIALSRRVEKHWRLIGWGQIRRGVTIKPTVDDDWRTKKNASFFKMKRPFLFWRERIFTTGLEAVQPLSLNCMAVLVHFIEFYPLTKITSHCHH